MNSLRKNLQRLILIFLLINGLCRTELYSIPKDSLDKAKKEKSGKSSKNKSVSDTSNISKIYNSHHKHMLLNKKVQKDSSITNPVAWSKEKGIAYKKDLEGEFVLDTAYQVFGFHPYWMGESYKYYNYSLLTILSYLSYELEPSTGNFKTLNHWVETDIVEVAKAGNPSCKVLLTVTNFGENHNQVFLNNPKARKKLIRNLLHYVKLKNADGITIDFEVLRHKDKNIFSVFIKELKTAMQKEDENYILAITLPAFDYYDTFDEATLSKYADWMVMMSYDYHNAESANAGPVSPLKNSSLWGGFSIDSSIEQYILDGVPPKKLILTVAYYGIIWKTQSKTIPGKSNGLVGYLRYSKVKSQFKEAPKLDASSLSVLHLYRTKDKQMHQCWYEDTTSLSYKYDYIKEHKLGGAGIFALGYDSGRSELWALLKKKFAVATISKPDSSVTTDSSDIRTDDGDPSDNGSSPTDSANAGKADGDKAGPKKDPVVTEKEAIPLSVIIRDLIKQYPNTIKLVLTILFLAFITGLVLSLSSIVVRRAVWDYKGFLIPGFMAILAVANIIFFDFYGNGIVMLDGYLVFVMMVAVGLFVWNQNRELP
jgi:spore germination protein YaaH